MPPLACRVFVFIDIDRLRRRRQGRDACPK
jgi:hypothetical protein